MAADNSLCTGDTTVDSFTEISIGKASPKDNVLPSPPTEGGTPLEEPKLRVGSSSDTSEQHLPNGSPDDKRKADSHDQIPDTDEDEHGSIDDGWVSNDKEKKDSETVEKEPEEISERVLKYGHYLQMMGEQML